MRAALDPSVDREDAIISIPETRTVTEAFGKRVVRDLSTRDLEFRQHMMPTEQLMDSKHWMMQYLKYWDGAEDAHPQGDGLDFFGAFDSRVIENFDKYQLPVINLAKETPKEAVCTVFEKVNTGGVSLNVFELATASFAADADSFSLRDDWQARRHRMYSCSGVLQGIAGDQFLQAVTLLKTQADRRAAIGRGVAASRAPAVGCKKRDILNLHLDDYRRWADRVERGFTATARFLKTQFIFGNRNVPYHSQLVPLAALFVELGGDLKTGIATERLERWYWSGVFGEIYGGTIETQFALDLVEVASFVRGGATPRLVNEANFVPERLITLRSRASAAYKGVYALQMKYGAADWMTTEPLSIANYDEEHIDIHHIFPVAWCHDANPEVPERLYNSIINKTPIDASTNRIIGGSAPSKYLGRLCRKVPSGKLDTLLESHWLHVDHLSSDDFAASFVARGEAILGLIGNAMGRDLGRGRGVFLSALQSAGHADRYVDDEVEFDEISAGEYEPEPNS